jgi:very-short-patch-repair endonuclease
VINVSGRETTTTSPRLRGEVDSSEAKNRVRGLVQESIPSPGLTATHTLRDRGELDSSEANNRVRGLMQDSPRTPTALNTARRLRREMTPAEVILWKLLRGRRFAQLKFRRQHPIGRFFADFICIELRLIIELDGDSHVGNELKDARRDEDLKQLGYRVLRFPNHDVYEDITMVEDTIEQACFRTPHPA